MRNYRPRSLEGRIGVYRASSSPMGRLARAIQKYWLNRSRRDSNYRQSNELPRKTWHLRPVAGNLHLLPIFRKMKKRTIEASLRKIIYISDFDKSANGISHRWKPWDRRPYSGFTEGYKKNHLCSVEIPPSRMQDVRGTSKWRASYFFVSNSIIIKLSRHGSYTSFSCRLFVCLKNF